MSYTQDPIRLLIVNDESSDLEYYRTAIQKHCSAKLEVHVFGPEEVNSQQVARSLLKALLQPAKHLRFDSGSTFCSWITE